MKRAWIAMVVLVGCGGAGADEGEAPDLGVAQAPIRGGVDVTVGSPFAASTVRVNGGTCTGTIIGRRHVLTAAHCGTMPGGFVTFYTGGFPSALPSATILRVYQPVGVTATNLLDTSGKFADFSVLELRTDIPAGYRAARIAEAWPGNNVWMYQVGIGNHDGAQNSIGVMRYRSTLSYAASDAEGHVLVEAATDPGDSGGPLYTGGSTLTVYGADYGNVWEWAWRGKYTSTAYHFDRIMRAMGLIPYANRRSLAATYATLPNQSPRGCTNACMNDYPCTAFSYTPTTATLGTCELKSGSGSMVSAAGVQSGIKSTGSCTATPDGICRL